MEWHHKTLHCSYLTAQLESPPPPDPTPPKWCCIAHFQAGQKSSIIGPSKQGQSCTDNNSATSHSCADASSSSRNCPQFSTPQLHEPLFEFNPSLPLVDPPATPNLLQPPGDAHTEASGHFVDNVLLNLHAQTHQTTNQSDDEGPEDALEGDAVETTDTIDHETEDFWNGGDVAIEGDVDPREGIVSDWDLLAEEFIVEAEELGKFGHSLLHTP